MNISQETIDHALVYENLIKEALPSKVITEALVITLIKLLTSMVLNQPVEIHEAILKTVTENMYGMYEALNGSPLVRSDH